MNKKQPLSGYTLPVFACAAAVAALRYLHQQQSLEQVDVDLIEPAQTAKIPIEQIGKLETNKALAITRSEPGDNLDLTRHTPVWAVVTILPGDGDMNTSATEQILITGGEGVGYQVNGEGKAAIYSYAQKLLRENLQRFLSAEEKIAVTIILPEGRRLAQRTSNAAFGVVEGLSLLGTTGIAQPLSTPEQLQLYLEQLTIKARQFDCLVFCLGENGLDLARKLGINRQRLVKTANWLGPMLVEAGRQKVAAILLFGYHGKLIKLAGGIFHTHHHLADGRLEILTAHGAKLGLPTAVVQQVFASATTEEALQYLQNFDACSGSNWAENIYQSLAATIDQRAQDYIRKHSEQKVIVGCAMFNRQRQIIVKSSFAQQLLPKLL